MSDQTHNQTDDEGQDDVVQHQQDQVNAPAGDAGTNGYGGRDIPQGEQTREQDPEQQTSPPDWRKAAMDDPQVRERFDQMLFRQQEAQAPERDPVEVLQDEIDTLNSQVENIDPNRLGDADYVTRAFNAQAELAKKTAQLTRLSAQRQQAFAQQQAAQQQYGRIMGQTRSKLGIDDATEREFVQHLDDTGITPELRANPTVVETLLKSFLYDRGMTANRQPQAQTGPRIMGPAGQANSRTPQAPDPNQPRQLTDMERQQARYFRLDEEKMAKGAYGSNDQRDFSIPGAIQYTDPAKLRANRRG